MVNTKILSLKMLNALDEAKTGIVRRTVIKSTMKRMPMDTKMAFDCKKDGVKYVAAVTAAKQLNQDAGRKEYLVVTRGSQKQTFTVYHVSEKYLKRAEEDHVNWIEIQSS